MSNADQAFEVIDLDDESIPCHRRWAVHLHRELVDRLITRAARNGAPTGEWFEDGPDHNHYFWVEAVFLPPDVARASAAVRVFGPGAHAENNSLNAPYLELAADITAFDASTWLDRIRPWL